MGWEERGRTIFRKHQAQIFPFYSQRATKNGRILVSQIMWRVNWQFRCFGGKFLKMDDLEGMYLKKKLNYIQIKFVNFSLSKEIWMWSIFWNVLNIEYRDCIGCGVYIWGSGILDDIWGDKSQYYAFAFESYR